MRRHCLEDNNDLFFTRTVSSFSVLKVIKPLSTMNRTKQEPKAKDYHIRWDDSRLAESWAARRRGCWYASDGFTSSTSDIKEKVGFDTCGISIIMLVSGHKSFNQSQSSSVCYFIWKCGPYLVHERLMPQSYIDRTQKAMTSLSSPWPLRKSFAFTSSSLINILIMLGTDLYLNIDFSFNFIVKS